MRFVTHSHTAACCLFGGCFNIYRHTERFDESARNLPSTGIEHRWLEKRNGERANENEQATKRLSTYILRRTFHHVFIAFYTEWMSE